MLVMARPIDISSIGFSTPADSLCVSSVGYFRETTNEDTTEDPAAAAVSLLLEQFKRPIRDGEGNSWQTD